MSRTIAPVPSGRIPVGLPVDVSIPNPFANMSTRQQAMAAANYSEEITKLATLTGQDRKALAEKMARNKQEANIELMLSEMSVTGNTNTRNSLELLRDKFGDVPGAMDLVLRGMQGLTVGATAGAVNPKDQSYIDLGAALGNLDINSLTSTRSGSGETLTTNGLANGFQDLNTGYTVLIKLTSDNSTYTGNHIVISAKTTGGDGDSGNATSLTVKMVATDGAGDDQYTSGNLNSVAVAAKDTPKMRTTLFTITPTTAQGLGTAYGISASAAVSNTVS